MSPSPAPEAHEAALAELLGQHDGFHGESWRPAGEHECRRFLLGPGQCGCTRITVACSGEGCDWWAEADGQQDVAHRAHLASVLLAAGWLPPETVTEARAEGAQRALIDAQAEFADKVGPGVAPGCPAAAERAFWFRATTELGAFIARRADSLAPEAPSEAETGERWECGPHTNAWKGHDARCRRVPIESAPSEEQR